MFFFIDSLAKMKIVRIFATAIEIKRLRYRLKGKRMARSSIG